MRLARSIGPVTVLLLAALPAAAQDNKPAAIRQPGPPQIVPPGTPPGATIIPDESGNSGPAATGTRAPTGLGATTMNTDSAAAGNAADPERGVPKVGGGGGDGGGGQ